MNRSPLQGVVRLVPTGLETAQDVAIAVMQEDTNKIKSSGGGDTSKALMFADGGVMVVFFANVQPSNLLKVPTYNTVVV